MDVTIHVHELRIANHFAVTAFVVAGVYGLGAEARVVVGAKVRWLSPFT